MKEKILDLARSQIGYSEESGNRTKYAKYFDTEAWQWFNTKKQGTEWCAIWRGGPYISIKICDIMQVIKEVYYHERKDIRSRKITDRLF